MSRLFQSVIFISRVFQPVGTPAGGDFILLTSGPTDFLLLTTGDKVLQAAP